jgi:peroxiredoxin Q/BCP
VIFGISFDSQKDNQAFAEKFGFNFPLLSDTDRKVGLAYGACDDVKAGSARRVAVIIGPDGMVKRYYPKVDARAFPQQALDEI